MSIGVAFVKAACGSRLARSTSTVADTERTAGRSAALTMRPRVTDERLIGVCSRHRTQRLPTPLTVVVGTGAIAPKSTDPDARNALVPSPSSRADVHAAPSHTSHSVLRSSGVLSSTRPSRPNDNENDEIPVKPRRSRRPR